MAEAATNISNITVIDGGRKLSEKETELGREVSIIEEQASKVVVTDDESLQAAVNLTSEIKKRQTTVTDFFEPMRKATKEAYDSVLARKKDMLDPLKKAEAILKNTIGTYQIEQDRKRREQEEAMKRALQAQMESQLSAAAAAEANGDSAAAADAMADAVALESASVVGLAPAPAKVKGLSTSYDWEIASIDDGIVPISINGMMIRPVDVKAVTKLAKATKGAIQIPGITFRKVAKTSIRKV